jgi:hypothetical protein
VNPHQTTRADQPQSAGGYGDPRVDAALARLATVSELSGMDQVAEYEAVHRTLQDTLATIDEG